MPGPVRRLPTVLLALCVATVLTATGCGQGLDRETVVERFQAANPEVTGDQAGCVVDRLIDRYGLDGLDEQLDAGSGPGDEFTEVQFRAMFTCGVEGDVQAQLTEQLAANGVADEDAPCVAGALTDDLDDADIDVLLSGEITEAFMAKFVAAMEACDAIDAATEG